MVSEHIGMIPPPSGNGTLGQALLRQRMARPDAVAFDTPSRGWTYAQVDDTVNRVAQALRAMDVGPGDRVACLTRHTAEAMILVLGASRLGAVCAPVNWRLAGPEIAYIVDNAQACFLLVDREFLAVIESLALPLLRACAVTEGVTYTLPGFADWYGGFDAENPLAEAGPDDTAIQLYSSGTTGLPKGVELSHRNLLIACAIYARELDFGPASVMLNALPSFHIAGVENALTPLIEGGRVVFHTHFDAAEVLQALQRERISHTFLVPAMILFLLQQPGVESGDFTALRTIAYGGSPAAERLLSDAQRTFGCGLLQSYGMTEATGTMSWLLAHDHDPDGPRRDLLRSAGTAAPGVEIRVVDSASGADLSEGDVGEIWVRTLQNMRGYWRNPDATAFAFPQGRDPQGGWMRTGDAGYRRGGYLYIHDRIKDMIISGGENIYPAEVENVLSDHPAVLECAVIGVPDERWGEAVKACVVWRSGQSVLPEELIAYTRTRLAHFKCPKTVDVFSSLPRNPSGKLLKRILRQPYWQGLQRQVA